MHHHHRRTFLRTALATGAALASAGALAAGYRTGP